MNTQDKQNIAKAFRKAAQLIEEMAMCIRSLDEYDDCEDACDQADIAVEEFKTLANIVEED